MNWEAIADAGDVAIRRHKPVTGPERKAAKFLEQTVKEFVCASYRYFELTGDLPFTYRERQTHSALMPAIAKVTDTALVEVPVTRRIKRKARHGWVDYWVSYRSTDLYLELKHGWQSINSQKIRQKTSKSWEDLAGQIKSLDARLKDISLSSEIVKVGLMLVPCYKGSRDKTSLKPVGRDETTALVDLVRSKLEAPAPTWSAIWHLPPKLQQEPYAFKNESWFELYAAVLFMVYIERVN